MGRSDRIDGWPKDVLRHTYASYRNATLRNLAALAEEMGTSVRILEKHYHNPRAEAEGQQWFALRPGATNRHDTGGIATQSIG